MFAGIYPPIPTPFAERQLSAERLKENIDRWLPTDLTGFVVAGSNGESPFLSNEEKVQAVAAVREAAPGRKVIAGTGCETTAGTVELTAACAGAGADAALVISPHYFTGNMTQTVLRRHYERVAEASPVPVLLYNMPKNTGINLDASLVIELSAHPNIVGIKDSSGNIVQLSEIVAGAQAQFEVFAGSGSFLLPALVMGAAGGMMAVANVAPDACCRLAWLVEEGRFDDARRLQQVLLPVNAAVTSRFGVPGLKAAMDILGYYGGDPQSPLEPLGEDDRQVIADILSAFHDEWDDVAS